MNQLCLLSDMTQLHRIGQPVVGHFVTAVPAAVEPWASILAENSAGGEGFSAPLFVAQGMKDTLVLPAATEQFVADERTLGVDVEFHSIDDADHGTVGVRGRSRTPRRRNRTGGSAARRWRQG